MARIWSNLVSQQFTADERVLATLWVPTSVNYSLDTSLGALSSN
jgi:hypothetical protein